LPENQEGAGRQWKDGELDLLALQVEVVRGEEAHSPLWPQAGPAIPLKEISSSKLPLGKERDCAHQGPLTAAAP